MMDEQQTSLDYLSNQVRIFSIALFCTYISIVLEAQLYDFLMGSHPDMCCLLY